ncbi:hypothetical protein D3C87_80300 [compost metagenome]
MDGKELEQAVIVTSIADDFTSKIEKVMTLKKNDIIVFKVPESIYSNESIDELRNYLKSLGIDNEILFLADGMDLSILRKE